jgi:hypothetical protein
VIRADVNAYALDWPYSKRMTLRAAYLLFPAVLAPALAVAAGDSSRPPGQAASLRAPEARAGGYRFLIERLVQYQSVNQDWSGAEGPDGPAPGPPRASASQGLYVYLAVQPPAPGLLPNIDGLDEQMTAESPRRTPLALRELPAEDADPKVTGLWRAVLHAQGMEPSDAALKNLRGELIVYPKARIATLEVPLSAPVGASREADGMRATLKQVRFRSETLTVSLEMAGGKDVRLGPPPNGAPAGIVAVTGGGNVLTPSGASTEPWRAEGKPRNVTVTFTELKEKPDRLRLQMLIRSGAPKVIPFTFPEIVLPQQLVEAAELDREPEPEVLQEGHPLFDPAGGTLTAPGSGGRLLIALSLKGPDGYGPWRWLEAEPDRRGAAVNTHLRPGEYRVQRHGSGAVRRGGMVEVKISTRGTTALPAGETP